MWKEETRGELIKFSLDRSNSSDFPKCVCRASFLLNPKVEGNFQIIEEYSGDPFHPAYRTSLEPNTTKMRVKIIVDGMSYGLNIDFFTGQQMNALAGKAMTAYKELINQNAEEWFKTKVVFEEDLAEHCSELKVEFDQSDLYDNGKLDILLKKLKTASRDNLGDHLEYHHQCAKDLELAEGVIAAELERLGMTAKQMAGSEVYSVISHVQRGRIPYGKPLETSPTMGLTEPEIAAIKPYLVNVIDSLPPLPAPFLPNHQYMNSVERL